jgi:hypothetical protein
MNTGKNAQYRKPEKHLPARFLDISSCTCYPKVQEIDAGAGLW